MSTKTSTFVRMTTSSDLSLQLEEYVGFYGDPLLVFRDTEVKRKPVNGETNGEDKALSVLVPVEESNPGTLNRDANDEMDEDVEWEKYNPPAALKTAPNITDGILLEILHSSIENITTRIAEDDRQRQIEEAKRRQDADNVGKEMEGGAKEPYLPVAMLPDDPELSTADTQESNENLKLLPGLAGNGEGSSALGLIVLPIKPRKKSRFALTRMLPKVSDKEGRLSARNPFKFGSNSSKTSLEGKPEGNRTSSNKLKKTAIVECASCLEDFSPKDVVKVTCHCYCHDCFERLIAAAVQNEQQWPPKCCLNVIPFRTILRYVSKDLGKTYKERSAEWKVPVSERIYCNQPDCSLWIKPNQVNNRTRVACCTNGHLSCIFCHGPQHENSDCPQDRDMALTNALAADEGWRHCAKCNVLVEHLEACQHMTCRCGHHFCYVCGAKWKSCECTMDQLHALKAGASNRREQRRRRELEDAQDLEDALRQIEEFEREEALKAELLRQEMEERTQRELEARVQRESLRRYEIEVKYQQLGEKLDQLHDLQEGMVRYQHDKEAEILSHEASATTAELVSKQHAELRELFEAARQKLTIKEQALANEYSCRVFEEKKTEDIYKRQLESFFAGKLSAEERVEEQMKKFRNKMDQGWRTWKKWQNDEFTRYRLKMEEERTIREEVMYSIKQRHEETLMESKNELKKKQAAELHWVPLVVAERTRMLAEMETTELEDGAESFSNREDPLGEEGEAVTDTVGDASIGIAS